MSKNFDVRAFIRDSAKNKKIIGKIFDERTKADTLHDTDNFYVESQFNHLSKIFVNFITPSRVLQKKFIIYILSIQCYSLSRSGFLDKLGGILNAS